MKLAISNIAWPSSADEAVAELLIAHGVQGIEVAPPKLWAQPLTATDEQIKECRRFWNSLGIEIVAAQSLLFGRPEMTIFDDVAVRRQTFDYLVRMIDLCARLGCQSLVFGSPKNRRIGTQPRGEIWPVAVEFFAGLAEAAQRSGTCVVLEANPPQYGADFITHAADAIELVQVVNRPGLRLHLDTACMTLAGDDVTAILERGLPWLKHFHISDEELRPVGTGQVPHETIAGALRATPYKEWLSIEMRECQPFTIEGLAQAVEFAQRTYAGCGG